MIIGYDASRALVNQRTGVENYSYQLLLALANLKCQHRFLVYIRGKQVPPATEAPRNGAFSPAGGRDQVAPALRFIPINWPLFWTQGGLALETWFNPPELLFIPAHTVPFLKSPRVKTVVTVHDLWTHDLPQSQNPIQRMYLNLNMEKLRARLATHIIAVSQSTKKDIIELLGVPEEKVSVVYEGVEHGRFAPEIKNQKSKIKKIKDKYGIGENYLLFVGTIQPRKNLVRLIRAFAQVVRVAPAIESRPRLAGEAVYPAFRRDRCHPRKDFQLILAGTRGWMADEIYAAPAKFGVGEKVKFIDYVADEDLPYLYAGAHAFILPSLHEGFGLPVLEAMACGTPAIVSQASSLPEVAGKTGIYVDPESVESIANGILEVLNCDETTCQQLSQKCFAQAQKFSWEKCAQETLAVFEKVLAP